MRFLVLLAGLAVFGADLFRPPEAQWSAAAAVAGIHAYQRHLSRFLAGAGIGCRFRPTCSVYAETAIRRDGLLKGGWRAFTRILRCGPWTPMGTVDPAE